jgi:quinol monooxygenase YgiN
MIFVAGTLTMDSKNVEEFDRDVKTMLKKVRAEDGCLHYSLLVEDAGAGVVNVVERWESDAALANHLKQPWIVTFFNKHGPRMTGMDVHIYDIAGGPRALPAM